MSILSDKLKELRKKRQVYQKDVASILGIDRTTYVKYERGQSDPDSTTLKKLADYFGVTADYLLGRTDNPNPPKPHLPDELQVLLDKQEHEHVLYTLSAGGRNQQMVILSDEEYDWLKATLKTYREQKEKSENQEK